MKLLALIFLINLPMILSGQVIAQDTLKDPLDTLKVVMSVSFSNYSSSSANYSLYHWSTKDDSLIYHKHKELITSDPTENNYIDYYTLACSLWELNKLIESKTMFLKIVNSKKQFYTDTYHRASDISGDTLINQYGYGSYTFNYKNQACLYLTKINIELKQYKSALEFLELADKKHTAVYTCGTGSNGYRRQLEGLYSLCYYGLGMYDTTIEKYLSNYLEYNNGILVKSLKKKYTEKEITNYLIMAEKSIEYIDETSNDYGHGTINLFGKKMDMPRPDLENGETLSRELYLTRFKKSGFYKALTE